MERRKLLVALAAGGVAGCTRGTQQRSTTGTTAPPQAQYGPPTSLPAPAQNGDVSLERAIAMRRSVRRFGSESLPLATIGQLLWAGQGITDPTGKRAAPSAGALYPMELYVVTDTQVMHYLPEGHRIETRATADLRPQLRAAALDQNSITAAPMVFVLAAQPDRLRARYGSSTEAYVNMEVGHVAQNILLVVAAHRLAAVPIATLDSPRIARELALPPGYDVRYLIPVGHSASH